MRTSNYNFAIDKHSLIKPVVIIRSGDHDIDTIKITLSNQGDPVDLTNAAIKFMGTTPAGNKIIDDVHSKIVDAPSGIFEYTFPSAAGSSVGEYQDAYFSIILGNGQTSTMNFRIQVLSGVDISAPAASDYVSQYNTMVSNLNSAYDSATKATNQKMASTVSSLATSAATVLDSALARVNTINSTANSASSAASNAVSMASSVANTVTSQASYINSVASSAASNVSSVAAGVVDKLNNLTIGGRNLFLNSRTLSDRSYGVNGNATVTVEPFDNTTNMWHFVAAQGNGGNVGIYLFDYGNGKIPNNSDWCYSADIKGTGKIIRFGFENDVILMTRGHIGDNWSRISQTGHIGEPQYKTIIIYFDTTDSPLDVYIKLPKLEVGNVPTDWTPAPEDAPINDTQLVHKTGTETIDGDKKFTSPINGVLATRNATFTDFNDVARNMVKYSGSWVVAAQSIANSPLQNYYTAIITPGFTGGTDGYIELVPFAGGVSKKYIAVVGSGTLSTWKSFAFDDDVVHKTDNETVAGDKTFTGKVTIPKNKVTVNTAYGTFTLTKTLDIVHIQSHISKDIPDNISVPNVVPQGFRPDGVSVPMTFIHGLDNGVIAVNPDGSLYTSSNIVPNTSFLAASWAVAGN